MTDIIPPTYGYPGSTNRRPVGNPAEKMRAFNIIPFSIKC